jgi:hypothetical protein
MIRNYTHPLKTQHKRENQISAIVIRKVDEEIKRIHTDAPTG